MTFPPIDAHGFLSDTHTTALVGPDGGVDWLCVPAADGPSLFARILDRERGGTWRVAVDGGRVTGAEQVEDSFVLRTRWEGPDGAAEVLDLLAVHSGQDPEDPDPDHLLVRVVRATRGTVRVVVDVDARPDHARARPRWRRDGEAWAEEVSGVRLASSVPLHADGDRLGAAADLAEGGSAVLALGYAEDAPSCATAARAEELVDATRTAWQRWAEDIRYEGPAAAAVRRSALLLRALSFDETGALLAAPTTSLPEDPGGERNWDYRFTWHRDASLHVQALYQLGHGALGRRYGEFLIDRCVRGVDRFRPMAGLRGEQSGEEAELGSLSGYAGSRPVRVGNEAFEQVQHETYGLVLDAAFTYRRLTGELPAEHWEALREVVETAARCWREPDNGIWELRGPPRHFTNSKVMSWVCLDRGVRLAEETGDGDAPLERWRSERDAVREDVLAHGFDAEQGAFTMVYGEPALDASLLRTSLVGFLPGDDPRVVGTIEAIATGLGVGPALVHRYDTDVVDDGLAGSEGAFLLCSFEMVSALVLAGRAEEAQRRFDWLLAHAGPHGLYAEQMDSDGTALGNYPQAFSHLGLVEAAVLLARAGDAQALGAWVRRDPGSLGAPA
ncbi:glycoside hydrolase family 15 protein [Quadrisphaera sp. DSM 44207]|uniref:glycoside hydrolase family 15 protein n=1 Tax=Quadrisphaera sp. DSM 44207 TaxID=1881057 RepID=UPI0008853C28|nr:glycoside hydrolase family 15 protein [Quadrisphaera sp. DSM 44207]SDQ41725.1 Glucoamylase (glucan-1,4-alpha-glucosidase), GH15 family [Quadrisphaera sp. DSM 44207]